MNTPKHLAKQKLNVYVVVERDKATDDISDILRIFSNIPKAEDFSAGSKATQGAYLDILKWRVE